eukprot:338877-Prymnesium_polylepis.2
MAASLVSTVIGVTGSVDGIVRAWGDYGPPFACHAPGGEAKARQRVTSDDRGTNEQRGSTDGRISSDVSALPCRPVRLRKQDALPLVPGPVAGRGRAAAGGATPTRRPGRRAAAHVHAAPRIVRS